MKTRLGQALAIMLSLAVLGSAYAGWSIYRATDTTRVQAIALPNDVELRSGDIILAGGVSLQSRVVLSLTEGNRYSHVGLIHATPQGIYVIHAAPNGAGDGGVGDRVAQIPLSLFLSQRGYVAVQVLRLDEQHPESHRLAQDACDYALACAQQAIPFDGRFDLAEQDMIYCSELVYLAYQQAGYDWPDTIIRSISSVLVDGPVILPDAFAQCQALHTVWKHSTERQ